MCSKMKSFEEIKSQWASQESQIAPVNGPEIIMKKVSVVKKKQQLTNVILVITVLVLIVFFIYIAAYTNLLVTTALLLMILSLVSRIGLELISIKMLNNLNVSTSAGEFKQNMIIYYKKRARTHFIWTPLIIVLYSIGFILLLPSFKANLSAGFYNYIIVSSILLLLFFGLLFYTQIKKELRILKELKS